MKARKLLILILCVIPGFSVGFFAGEIMNNSKGDYALPKDFTITAHTGCMGTKQNSIESILVGLENADIIEFDLNFLPDGTPVLSHDEPKDDCVTLEQAFSILSEYKNKKANIDLKSFDNLKAVQVLSEKYGVTKRVFFTGVFEDKIETVKKSCPKIKYYLNVEPKKFKKNNESYMLSIIEKVKDCGAVGINCPYNSVSARFTELCRENDLSVSLWTANTRDQIRKAVGLSPNNITSKKPNKVKEIIGIK